MDAIRNAPPVCGNSVDQPLGCIKLPRSDMLEAASFEETDLLWRGKPLHAALIEPVEQLCGFACALHIVGENAHTFERLHLLL